MPLLIFHFNKIKTFTIPKRSAVVGVLALALQPGITNNSINPPNENYSNTGSFDNAFLQVVGVCFAAKPSAQHTTTAVCGFERMGIIGKTNTGIVHCL